MNGCCHYHLDIFVCGILQCHCAYPFHVSATFNLNVIHPSLKRAREERKEAYEPFFVFPLAFWLGILASLLILVSRKQWVTKNWYENVHVSILEEANLFLFLTVSLSKNKRSFSIRKAYIIQRITITITTTKKTS